MGIASSAREDQHIVSLCVGVVAEELQPRAQVIDELRTRGHVSSDVLVPSEALGAARQFRGACSSMLCTRVSPGDRLWVVARRSTFRLPQAPGAPVIMVGAGTGVAPFRGFVRELGVEGLGRRSLLFFGCTREGEDFLYKDELRTALSGEPAALSKLVTAFSRDQSEKVYVQHRLREHAAEVAALVRDGGHVYVCGATAMGAAIREELQAALGSAEEIGRLQEEGRFVEELW